jgi:Uma2 family endonuclease
MLIKHGITWEEYEDLLEAIGESTGLRVSFDMGTLEIMTVSHKHEKYSTLIERMVDRLSSYLRLKVLFFGSATMKKQSQQKGVEPDACFYVQNADLVGKKDELDFNNDPPPDVVVEIDLFHESLSKFPIYAALRVPELWRYEKDRLTIYHLRGDEYVPSENSQSLPLLDGAVLTSFLRLTTTQDQYDILLAFEEWLESHPH